MTPCSAETHDEYATVIEHDFFSVERLTVLYQSPMATVKAIDDVSFSLAKGEFLGIVGESGSGKSTLLLAILNLLPTAGHIAAGAICYQQTNLRNFSDHDWRHLRGNEISIVFQDAMAHLNPVLTVEQQIADVIRAHSAIGHADCRQQVLNLLDHMDIPEPERRLRFYPHELSGGMRQRICIAMAMAAQPGLILADEPTSSLDVTVQAQIIDLFRALQDETQISAIWVTHNLPLVAAFCDTIGVMYAGHLLEFGPAGTLSKAPAHPYTRKLFTAVPQADEPRGGELATIPGELPNLSELPRGCVFQDRCTEKLPRCEDVRPSAQVVGAGHISCCHLNA